MSGAPPAVSVADVGGTVVPQRVPDVLAVFYLVFNEGYSASTGDDLIPAGSLRPGCRPGPGAGGIAARRPGSHVADHVMSAMTSAAGYEDDVAVLIYRHPPVPLTVQVPAADSCCPALLRARLRQWLSAASIGAWQATDITIAAGEAEMGRQA